MPDQLQESLREALSAQLDPDSIARLRAIDYRPRQHRIRMLPAIGAISATGVAAAVATLVALGSSAAPAFAGWQSTPTTPAAGAPPVQACGQDLGSPVLTDSRGPYTASIYADSTTTDVCLSGSGVSMSSKSTTAAPISVTAGQIQFRGGGMRDSAGNALTLIDGPAGAGVTAVTIDLSDGSSIQATVTDGWYLAWWPGAVTATSAKVTTTSGTNTMTVPSTPALSAPNCPSGAHCAGGYSYGSAGGPGSASQSSVTINGGNSSQ